MNKLFFMLGVNKGRGTKNGPLLSCQNSIFPFRHHYYIRGKNEFFLAFKFKNILDNCHPNVSADK